MWAVQGSMEMQSEILQDRYELCHTKTHRLSGSLWSWKITYWHQDVRGQRHSPHTGHNLPMVQSRYCLHEIWFRITKILIHLNVWFCMHGCVTWHLIASVNFFNKEFCDSVNTVLIEWSPKLANTSKHFSMAQRKWDPSQWVEVIILLWLIENGLTGRKGLNFHQCLTCIHLAARELSQHIMYYYS